MRTSQSGVPGRRVPSSEGRTAKVVRIEIHQGQGFCNMSRKPAKNLIAYLFNFQNRMVIGTRPIAKYIFDSYERQFTFSQSFLTPRDPLVLTPNNYDPQYKCSIRSIG